VAVVEVQSMPLIQETTTLEEAVALVAVLAVKVKLETVVLVVY
tara:strand:+ start:174 stop:302 length:129 start_codon:yes stop_codon:yes gene_type:complete